ncbi:hypothetical protein [Nocardia sp. NPDC059239]|uniref:hypothetical protein n=1 Tax=Nocardia sp. NPDC059239 TaxID=3346785 RepID=UPI0036742CAB
MTSKDKPRQLNSLRYDMLILTTGDDGKPDGAGELTFSVDGLALPRVGDRLYFTEDDGLTVVVTEVEHWFNPDAPDVTRHRSITVVAHPDPSSREMTQKLLDPAELERWLIEYPWLSEYP